MVIEQNLILIVIPELIVLFQSGQCHKTPKEHIIGPKSGNSDFSKEGSSRKFSILVFCSP